MKPFGSPAVIAIVRATNSDRFVAVAEVLYQAGIRNIEVTLTAAGALASLGTIRERLPTDAHLGVGSVRTVDDATASIDAGAAYLVAPTVNAGVIKRATQAGTAVIPGALTPTEVVAAWDAGATAVKVFPVSAVGGPTYLTLLRAPLPDIPLIPTGGISIEAIPSYLAAGAVAVGMGKPLIGDAAEPSGDLAALGARAARAVALAEPEQP